MSYSRLILYFLCLRLRHFSERFWSPFNGEEFLEIKNWLLFIGVVIIIGMLLFPGLSGDGNLYMLQRDLYKNSYAALFIQAQNWKQHKCIPTGECMNIMVYSYIGILLSTN